MPWTYCTKRKLRKLSNVVFDMVFFLRITIRIGTFFGILFSTVYEAFEQCAKNNEQLVLYRLKQ